jgi:hypothetical protein
LARSAGRIASGESKSFNGMSSMSCVDHLGQNACRCAALPVNCASD